MSVNSRCWELKGAGGPPVLVESTVGRPNADEVLIKIDACTLWCADLSYSYAGTHTEPQRSPKPSCRICGHVVEAGADALYFTDRAVTVSVVAPCRDEAPWFGAAALHPMRKTPGSEIDDGDCMIVSASELHLIEQDCPVSSNSNHALAAQGGASSASMVR